MRKLGFLLACIAIPAITFADVVTEQDALMKAKQFMPGKSFEQPQKPNRAPARGGKIDNPAYYVFNATGNEGFVIVSADDRTEAILGYADNGYFDQDNLPSNVKAWFEFYEQSIRSLGDAPAQAPQRMTPRAAIEPLIKTKWNQSNPYNLQCPMDGEERSITGCVATAIAQIMNYHQWPASTTQEIPAYTTKTKAINVETLPTTTFKWDLMKYEYQNDAVGDTANAVAELMRYCGQALLMDYTSEESAASVNPANLINYFNYSQNARMTPREYYSNNQWEDLVYNELANNRPVAYSGDPSDANSGHEFICDGYDGNGLFHINWGWGGHYDGYFLLSDLNPSGRGLGGGNSSQGYSDLQWILIGFTPASDQEEQVPQMIGWDVSVSESNYERNSTATDFESISLTGFIHTTFRVLPQKDLEIETGWALYSNDTLKQCLGYKANTVSNVLESDLNNSMSVSFGSDVKDGQYRICQVYRLAGETEWYLSQDAIRECLVVNVTGNNMTVQKINYFSKITVNSIKRLSDPFLGNTIYYTLNITNNGETFNQKVILSYRRQGGMYVGNTVPKVTASIYLNPEETCDVTIGITPAREGTYDIDITTNGQCNGETHFEETILDHYLELSNLTTYNEPIANQSLYITFDCKYLLDETLKYQNIYVFSKEAEEDIWKESFWFTLYDLLPQNTNKQGFYYYPEKIGIVELKLTLDSIGENVLGNIIVNVEKGIVTVDDITYIYNTNNEAEVVKYVPHNYEFTIPGSVVVDNKAFNVTSINAEPSNIIRSIQHLKISEGIKYICGNSFAGQIRLKTIELPSTLTFIGDSAFMNCEALRSVISHIKNPFSIGENAFCYDNADLFIPQSAEQLYKNTSCWRNFRNILAGYIMEGDIKDTTIYDITYRYSKESKTAIIIDAVGTINENSAIQSSIIVDGVECFVYAIDDHVFQYKYNSKTYSANSLTIPEGIIMIGEQAFMANSIQTLELPSTLLRIGSWAFQDPITSVTIKAENPPIIEDQAFEKANGNVINANLFVPAGTVSKYQNASEWNKFIQISEMPAGNVITINGITYQYDTTTRTASIKEAVTTISESSQLLSSITIDDVVYPVVAIDDRAFSNRRYSGDNLIIPEGITKIGKEVFFSNLIKTLELPSTITFIDIAAFYACSSLTTVIVHSKEPPTIVLGNAFDNDNNSSYGKQGQNIKLFVPSNSASKYQDKMGWDKFNPIQEESVPEITIDGITYQYLNDSKTASIKEVTEVITDNSKIRSSIIVNDVEYTVTTIIEGAFYGSYSDTILVIPEGVTTIEASAFRHCSYNLRTIDLPSTIKEIGSSAFTECYDLQSVIIRAEEPPIINSTAFAGIRRWGENDKTVNLYVLGGTVNKYNNNSGWSTFTNISDKITIKAASYTIEYGQPMPTFEFTYEGAPINGIPSLSCSATEKSPVGTYPIKIGNGSVKNGIKSKKSGTLTITQAPLTIAANSYTIKQGDPIPPLQVTYKGFMNDEDSTVLSKLPIVSTKATSSSAPGVYYITVSGAEAQNYRISYVRGKLTIESNTAISDITDDDIVSVYTLSGTMLYNSIDIKNVYDQLPSGIYIIRQKDQKTRKLIR